MIRIDRAERMVHASAQAVWQAFVEPAAWTVWLPPTGMTARMDGFEFRPGGRYRLTLVYDDPGTAGKSDGNTDVVQGMFVAIEPRRRLVQDVTFASDDPAFAGTMRMTWSLSGRTGGTLMSIACENVPPGIGKADHDAGLAPTLDNLAAFAEA